MEEQPGLSDEYRKASPWPLFVALGFAVSEIGVFLGIFPVAVGGVLLLGGSVAGILRESEYATRTWRTLGLLGLAFALLGAAVVAAGASGPLSLTAVVADPNGAVGRGLAIAVGGLTLVAASVVGRLSTI
ncbi:MAG: cox cluster protein [Haloarculaceae archaeon]